MGYGLVYAIVGQVINIGSGKEISIQNLAQIIFGIVGKELPIVRGKERLRPEASEVERLCADNEKAKRLLGWEPKLDLEAGLTRTIDYFKEKLAAQ